MKPPLGSPVPIWTTQAEEKITLVDEGLETEQVVSVGRKPEPVNATSWPDPLNEITGSA
jgi:hypothetical protein